MEKEIEKIKKFILINWNKEFDERLKENENWIEEYKKELSDLKNYLTRVISNK